MRACVRVRAAVCVRAACASACVFVRASLRVWAGVRLCACVCRSRAFACVACVAGLSWGRERCVGR